MKFKGQNRQAFSLVEVVLALAVVSFCLLTVLGLIPLSVNSSRDTMEQTTAGNIAAEISADFHVTPRVLGTTTNTPHFNISYAPGTTSFYFDNNNNFSANSTLASIYRATVTVSTPTPTALTTVPLRILVTWPGLADPQPAQNPTHYTGSVDVCTAANLISR